MSKSKDLNSSVTARLYREIEKEFLGDVAGFKKQNVGEVVQIGDGIARVRGLSDAMFGETVVFDKSGVEGLVINLTSDEVGIIVLGDYMDISEGDSVSTTGRILAINVSERLLGRVVNPMMTPVDGKGAVYTNTDRGKLMPVEKIAPGIIFRESVSVPLQTGIKAVDGVIPIGRGQRELIIGDRNTGKTAVAVDAIINQSKLNKKKGNKKVVSVFVAIGQKQSRIAQLIDKLSEAGAIDDVIFVVANASDPVSLQYLAPYAGCAVAEYFMEKGEDVLIVYDDLTKHAWAYRQISLVLKRPSGREAYPGDIFYLHSKLLERSCRLSKDLGGGSMTALPIVETQAQDISAFIPTNIISITDGQIYLEPDLFYQGIRPAINVGLSVSRVGGAAQLKAMKQVAGKLKLDIAQFNELAAFAQFGSDMDNITKQKIERGKRIIEVLKQPQYVPLSVEDEVLQIWLVTRGHLDNIEIDDVNAKSMEFIEKVKATYPEFSSEVYSKEGISKESEEKLSKVAQKVCVAKA